MVRRIIEIVGRKLQFRFYVCVINPQNIGRPANNVTACKSLKCDLLLRQLPAGRAETDGRDWKCNTDLKASRPC